MVFIMLFVRLPMLLTNQSDGRELRSECHLNTTCRGGMQNRTYIHPSNVDPHGYQSSGMWSSVCMDGWIFRHTLVDIVMSVCGMFV